MTSAILHSLLFAGLAAMLASLLGSAAFVALATSSRRTQLFLIPAAIACLLMPPFLQADAWVAIATQLEIPIRSLVFGAAVLSLQLWPITTLLLFAMSRRLDSSLLESARLSLSPRDTWTRVILPLLSPALALAWVAGFVLALNNFLIPTTFQTHTQLTNIYVDFVSLYNTRAALIQSIPLWIISVTALAAAAKLSRNVEAGNANRHSSNGDNPARHIAPLCGRSVWLVFALTLLLVSIGPPLFRIVRACLHENLWSAFLLARPQLGASLAYAVGGAALAVLLAGAVWLIAGSPRRRDMSRRGKAVTCHRTPRLQAVVEWLLATPFILSGFFLCIAIIAVSQWAGKWAFWQGTWVVCILAYGIRFIWIPYKAIASSHADIRSDLLDAASVFRLPRRSTLRHIEWPAMRPALFAAAWIVYVLVMWDVETIVLIHPPGGESTSLRIYQLLHDGAETSVAALSVALLAMGLAPGLALLFFRGGPNRPLPVGSSPPPTAGVSA